MKSRLQQIRQIHARFIHAVVKACQNENARAEAEPILAYAAANGWSELVAVCRKVIAGNRQASLLEALDQEDRAIAGGILEGLQNPASLPDQTTPPQAHDAAPGLASIIHAAAHGEAEALQALGTMGEQMSSVGGEMAQLAAVFRRLLNGERNVDQLGTKMGPKAHGLLLSILDELAKLDVH